MTAYIYLIKKMLKGKLNASERIQLSETPSMKNYCLNNGMRSPNSTYRTKSIQKRYGTRLPILVGRQKMTPTKASSRSSTST